MKVKKVMGILLATALTASALFGCGTKDTRTSDNGDKVVVSISFWEGSTKKALQNSLKEISDKYTELHPNVVFDFQPQPNSGYQDWIKARMAADDAPVIEGNNTSVLKDQYKNGSLYSFSEEFNKPNPYVEGNKAWKDMFVDGKVDAAHEYETEPTYAVPTSGMGIGIYYNKDIYKELGLEIPETWDKFIENCKKINDSGKNPVAMMLMKKNATVTVCHTKTKDMAGTCRNAEVLVAAAGSAKMIKPDYVADDAVVIDVGINVDESGNLCGDVDFDSVAEKTSVITPVPGGVGSVTTSVLAKHLLRAAKMRKL